MSTNKPLKQSCKIILATIAFALPSVLCASMTIEKHFNKIHLGEGIQHKIENVQIVKTQPQFPMSTKDWTIMLYIAADNDLAPFAIRNIKQMALVGSNKHFNIVVQLDIRKTSGEKITRRYYIQKGQVLHLNASDPTSQKMDSGSPATLVSFCKWSIENFPAEQFGLVLWNHGTGILDPKKARTVRADELFFFNPETNQFELDRSMGYIERMLEKGICWDDSTGNFLSNGDIKEALSAVQEDALDGEKFLFIGFDACLMQMLEVASNIKDFAHIMIGSQEVELGYGWNYADILTPLTKETMNPVDLAEHIVTTYKKTYEKIIGDFTLSAINLDAFSYQEKNLDEVAKLLIEGLKLQKNNSVRKMIKTSRAKKACTQFDEPSYIDLHHFYGNLVANINQIKLKNSNLENEFKKELTEKIKEGRRLIESIAFAHVTGNKLPKARGVSIYFPLRKIHQSYLETQDSSWLVFLKKYLYL